MDGLVIVNGVNDASLGLKRMEFAFIKQGGKMSKIEFVIIFTCFVGLCGLILRGLL